MGRSRGKKPEKQKGAGDKKVIQLPGTTSTHPRNTHRAIKLLVDALEDLNLVKDVADEVARRKWLEGVGLDEKLRLVIRQELAQAKEKTGHGGGELLTVNQAARRVEVTPGTIREWIKKNKLTAVKAGRQYRIRRADLDQCLIRQVENSSLVDIDAEAARLVSMDRSKRER